MSTKKSGQDSAPSLNGNPFGKYSKGANGLPFQLKWRSPASLLTITRSSRACFNLNWPSVETCASSMRWTNTFVSPEISVSIRLALTAASAINCSLVISPVRSLVNCSLSFASKKMLSARALSSNARIVFERAFLSMYMAVFPNRSA